MRKLLGRVALVAVSVSSIAPPCFADESALVRPTVLDKLPHDPEAFTQGLLVYDGDFFESTGQYGESTLRRVDIETGQVLASVALDSSEFGEGLARVGDRLLQLTWQEQVAHVYSIDQLTVEGSFSYEGEGWGLCFDGERLVMSDGSSKLFFRDPDTFELLEEVTVTLDDEPISMLNELECVSGQVYANVWMTDQILRIDTSSGAVLAVFDASGLLTSSEAADANVLNGIAYDPERRHFFITGKYWPWMFEVEFDEPQEGRNKLPSGCGCKLAGARAAPGPVFGVLLLLGLLWCRGAAWHRRSRTGMGRFEGNPSTRCPSTARRAVSDRRRRRG